MPSSPHSHNDQPDLRPVIADAINELSRKPEYLVEQSAEPVMPEQVSIACQRTLRTVETANSKLNGGDLSACIALMSKGDDVYPWFFVTCRRAGEEHWRPVASVGGAPTRIGEPFLGKLGGSGGYVAIGSLAAIPDGGGIRIELPDGSINEDWATDGCCIALGAVNFRPSTSGPITIRYLNSDGSEWGSETV